MQAIFDLKEQHVTDTPLIVFDCVLANGQTEHWSTHRAIVGDTTYEARVLQHSAFDIQTASDQGIDGSPRISIVLANADSHFSEIERATGWKGARLTVGFLFYDLLNGQPLTDTMVAFQGTCNPPDQIQEATFRLTAVNRMGLQRLQLPQIRIQRRCPWEFPATEEQRGEAVHGGVHGKYSLYYRCGYSAGVEGGTGNLNGDEPFTTCGYTRTDCQARGMFQRFGGLEFVPPAISVRGYGKEWSTSALSVNQARYNDYVPMVYGTGWHAPTVVFARNDGNLTRMEVLLGVGEMQGVLTVLVNNVEIPLGMAGSNMTGTGWYNIRSLGARDGCFDDNFLDGSGQPAGDPYGSMAYLSVVVPNQVNNANSLPRVKVLVEGLKVPTYGSDGGYLGDRFSSNPSWILLDVLRRSGWVTAEIDLPSFSRAAAFCDEEIDAVDPNGNAILIPRFQCNVVLHNRRSAGDVVRGIRNAARLYLTYGPGGKLQAHVENTAALQGPVKPVWSNSSEMLNGGWASYEFGDGSNGFSGILRRANGEPTVSVTSRSIADTPNRMSAEFQDALNGYQQDSYEMVDAEDARLTGQVVSSTLAALGIPHYDQAGRILKFNLDKSLRGNTYVEFQSSVKAFGIAPGDLITVTYLKEGFNWQAFRVLKISPATNYRTATITAQIHDDAWYADTNGRVTSASGAMRESAVGMGAPKPLLGSVVDGNGDVQFGVEESATTNSDGTMEATVSVSFVPPAVAAGTGPGVPLLSLAPAVSGGGTLASGQTLYYAVSGADSGGRESGLSFLVRATILTDDSSVTLNRLSFAAGTTVFHVYRGSTPATLLRIAGDEPVADSFTDTGLENQLVSPPDANFDHANFYWRQELAPETAVIAHSATSVGNGTLRMAANAYRGMVVRVTRGTGAGQERAVMANDETSLTVTPWHVEPDASSWFCIAESGWHFAAFTKSSPVQFAIPNRRGEVVQICGRAANINDVECAAESSTVTRWTVGGSGGADALEPPLPIFGLGLGRGSIELSGVAFPDLENTHSVSSCTLTLHYWNELQGAPGTLLASDIGDGGATLVLNTTGPAEAGSLLQIEGEILQVVAVAEDGTEYAVERGFNGSEAAEHGAQTPVYHLASKTTIVPFPAGFFGSPYCGNWGHSIALPDVRVSSAELFVTNAKGNSPTAGISLTHNDDRGLRTLSGGQYSIQVSGFLAVEQCVAPAVVAEASHSVRDVYAVLGTPADAPVQVRVNTDGDVYCTLTFEAGTIVSDSFSGTTLAPLTVGTQVTVDILSVGTVYPGANLTVLIRL